MYTLSEPCFETFLVQDTRDERTVACSSRETQLLQRWELNVTITIAASPPPHYRHCRAACARDVAQRSKDRQTVDRLTDRQPGMLTELKALERQYNVVCHLSAGRSRYQTADNSDFVNGR